MINTIKVQYKRDRQKVDVKGEVISGSSDSESGKNSPISSFEESKEPRTKQPVGKSYLERCAKVGRVGPPETSLDKKSAHGELQLRVVGPKVSYSQDENLLLEVEAKSSFVSIRADTAVFKNRFYYEVTLKGDGMAQIGWC